MIGSGSRLHLDPPSTALLGLLVASLLGLVDGRVSVVFGLVCIALCPILLIAERQAWLQQSVVVQYYACAMGLCTLKDAAEPVAVWAYYFLCIGVITQIAQLVLGKKRATGERKQPDDFI
jgi:hypothetical protein